MYKSYAQNNMSTNKSGHDRIAAEARQLKKEKREQKEREKKERAEMAEADVKRSPLARVQEIADEGMARVIKNKKRDSVPYPTLPSGAPNPNYHDLLFEYPKIPSQEYGVYSFISPERHIRRREMFMFEQFVRQWSYSASVNAFSEFINFMSMKHSIPLEGLKTDLADFVADKTNQLGSLDVTGDFAGYVEMNHEKLDAHYERENGFETSVRGFVPLGNFPTKDAADAYAKRIREMNPDHNVLVSLNFHWVPLDPDLYKLPDISYLEPELNRLHQEKKINDAKAKAEFERRVYEAKRKMVEDNISNALKHGGKVTQTMDEEGNLIRTFNPETDCLDREPAPEVLSAAAKQGV